MNTLAALLRAGKFYNAQHEKSDLHIQAADHIEALEAALEFYRDAWIDDFGFLGGEPSPESPIPSDALTDDRGARARAALAQGSDK